MNILQLSSILLIENKNFTYTFISLFTHPVIIGFVTALATFSFLKWIGSRNCKLSACFSIRIFVMAAANLVFISSKHDSMSSNEKLPKLPKDFHLAFIIVHWFNFLLKIFYSRNISASLKSLSLSASNSGFRLAKVRK